MSSEELDRFETVLSARVAELENNCQEVKLTVVDNHQLAVVAGQIVGSLRNHCLTCRD